jgi:hypothetical protein
MLGGRAEQEAARVALQGFRAIQDTLSCDMSHGHAQKLHKLAGRGENIGNNKQVGCVICGRVLQRQKI